MEHSDTGQQNLLDQIITEAKKEAHDIIAAAEKDAEAKVKSARAKAEQIQNDAEKRADEQIAEIIRHADSVISMDKKRTKLVSQETLFKTIIDKAVTSMSERAGLPDYEETVLGWLTEAAAGIGTDEAIVEGGEKEHSLLTDSFLKKAEKSAADLAGRKIKLQASEKACSGQGILVRDPEGRTAWDNRVHVRLSRREQEIRRIIAKTFDKEFSL